MCSCQPVRRYKRLLEAVFRASVPNATLAKAVASLSPLRRQDVLGLSAAGANSDAAMTTVVAVEEADVLEEGDEDAVGGGEDLNHNNEEEEEGGEQQQQQQRGKRKKDGKKKKNGSGSQARSNRLPSVLSASTATPMRMVVVNEPQESISGFSRVQFVLSL